LVLLEIHTHITMCAAVQKMIHPPDFFSFFPPFDFLSTNSKDTKMHKAVLVL